jgi:hypothetical protein
MCTSFSPSDKDPLSYPRNHRQHVFGETEVQVFFVAETL